MAILFKTTKELEAQIDEYLDSVSQGALVFKQGVKNYLENDKENFSEQIKSIGELENKADDLRRAIENRLYTQTLIPEHRGDVLGILESTDEVIDTMKETLNQFDIECPFIPEELNKVFLDLTDVSIAASENLVQATRAFFRDVNAVKDHLHKVYFYEKEADRIGNNLKRKVFQLDLDLSLKFHLRYFALHIQNVSDHAEGVADRLSIYTIKRTI
jgi:predicted phosphate transport protein (TIGR00153 family)